MSWIKSVQVLRFGGVVFSAVEDRLQPALTRVAEFSQEAASLVSVLFLNPGAMVALVFAVWRLGQDLGWAGQFLFSEGLFSHWMVWMMLAGGLKALAVMATRNTRNEKKAD